MKIYERYLAKEILASVLMVLFAFLMLFAFFDFINELDDVGRSGYQMPHAFLFVLLTLPGRAYELFPVAVLIGTLYALTQLAKNSEVTVLRASGLSTRAFVGTLVRMGLVFGVLVFVVGEFVAPPAERQAQQLRLNAMGSVVGQEFRSGLWIKDDTNFVNVQTVLPDTRLKGVSIYHFDRQGVLLSISEASDGAYIPPNEWRLTNVRQTHFNEKGVRVETLPNALWYSELDPEILGVLLVVPERMSMVALYRYVKHLAENKIRTDRYDIAMWKKLIYPLASIVMMILALPFAFLQDRMGGVSTKVFSGIMLGIFFHMLNGLFSNLGIINAWPPFLSAITPSVLFLMAAASMLWWVERR